VVAEKGDSLNVDSVMSDHKLAKKRKVGDEKRKKEKGDNGHGTKNEKWGLKGGDCVSMQGL